MDVFHTNTADIAVYIIIALVVVVYIIPLVVVVDIIKVIRASHFNYCAVNSIRIYNLGIIKL